MPTNTDISEEILNYLSQNPEANDALEGIIEWWLLTHKINYEMKKVKAAISNLIKDGWIIETKSRDSTVHYRLNPKKRKEIKLCV